MCGHCQGIAVVTTGVECCICLEEFDNGQPVFVLDCGGHHMLCRGCIHDAVEATNGSCPVCRGVAGYDGANAVKRAEVYVSQNYYKGSGSSAGDAIVID